MKIYFSCSITGGRAEEAVYQTLVAALERFGCEVPTAHLSSPQVLEMEKVVDAREIYERDMAWLAESDAIVAEVSSPSHGVGYEIAVGLLAGKPVFCCYQAGKKVSKILTGNSSKNLTLAVYQDPSQAVAALEKFLEALNGSSLH